MRVQAIETLFGLPATDSTSGYASGLPMYFEDIESRFQDLLHPEFVHIWTLIGKPLPCTSSEVWHWCFAVLQAYESLGDQDPSIEQVYRKILSTRPEYSASEDEKKYTVQAIFAVLCWTTGTLEPIVGEAPLQCPQPCTGSVSEEEAHLEIQSTALVARNCGFTYSSSDTRRPTSKMFHSYRLHLNEVTHFEPGQSMIQRPDIIDTGISSSIDGLFGDILYEPTLTYESLFIIGRVRIKWVNTITAHLTFDRATRELSVYKYPSFCAAKVMAARRTHVLERYVHKFRKPVNHLWVYAKFSSRMH